MAATAWKILDHRGNEIASHRTELAAKREKFLSAYRGASTGRTTADWGARPGHPDDTLLPERLSLIWRIDERMRNDPIMRGVMNRTVDSVVGPTGFTVQSQLDSERLGLSGDQAREIESDIDAIWDEWQEVADYAGNPASSMNFQTMLGVNYCTRLTRGGTLQIPRYRRRRWSRFSFCIQNVTTERIVHPHGLPGIFGGQRAGAGSTQEDIREGVKVGRDGGIVGIWVARRHPWSLLPVGDLGTDYIPAWNRKTGRANFWYRFHPYRMEATHGEPAFAACLAGFRAVGDYITDELTRAHMATMFGLAIYREEPFDPDVEGITDSTREVGDTYERAQTQVDWYAGQLNYLDPGDRVETVNPNLPGPQFKEFVEFLTVSSASPLPLSREQVLNDFGGLSWSGGKISRDEAERGVEREQEMVMKQYVAPARERVIEEAWMRGYLTLPGFQDPAKRRLYYGYQYFPPKRPYLEPVKEASGAEKRLQNGTSSLKLECARGGHSMRSILLDRVRERDEFERLGLPLPAYLRDEPVEVESAAPGDEAEATAEDATS